MADSFYVSGLRGKSDVFTPGGTGSMTSGDDYSRSGTEFYPVVNANDGNDGSAIDNLNTRGTEAPAGSVIQPSINDSVAVELMLEDKEVIIDTRGRVELPDIDDLDFINSSVKPNPYAYATSYYTTFYVRNYSYNWNDNSYLSVDINGKVTDIYANSYGTVRMDYYPNNTELTDVIGSIKFTVDVQNTNKYKTLEPGNYVVWNNNTATPVSNQPYCEDGLLHISVNNDMHHNLAYATISKNARIIVDSDVSNADISAVQKWWTSAYFTYVANIWQKFNVNTGNYLVSNTNGTYNYITGASILLDNIPDTLNKFFLICGNFGVGDEIVRYAVTFVITPMDENAGTIKSVDDDRIYVGKYENNTLINSQTCEFNDGDTVIIKIRANTHYTYSELKRNGSPFIAQEGESITTGNDAVGAFKLVTLIIRSTATYEVIFNTQQYHITVNSNNSSYGGVMGDGYYDYEQVITIAALPSNGYHFVSWNDGNTDNPRTITVSGDATFTGMFELNPPESLVITVERNGGDDSTIVLASPNVLPATGGNVTLQAIASTGYQFIKWMADNTEISQNATYNLSVTTSKTFTAYFGTATCSISVSASPNNACNVTASPNPVQYGDSVTLAVTQILQEYQFTGWKEANSPMILSTSTTYTVPNITSDRSFIATFEQKQYLITVNTNPDNIGMASASPINVSHGGSTELTANAENGYVFSGWYEGNNLIENGNNSTCTVYNITSNRTFTAHFTGDTTYDNEEESVDELEPIGDDFMNYIKPRVAIVSASQLDRIHGVFLPIYSLPDNYGAMSQEELSNMYNKSTYMICDIANTLDETGNIAFCNVVPSVNSISINLCNNYEEYCSYKYEYNNETNKQVGRYVILDADVNSLHSYTYNYVTTAFQATGDPNTICHTAAYINIYDNVVTQEFRNDGQYSIIDAMTRKNSTYMMYVSLNIDPYYEAKVIGGKNMTYTSVSLFKCSNYNDIENNVEHLQDNSNVTLFYSENIPNVTGLTNGIFNETSKRGAFVFMIDKEGETNIDITHNPSSFVDNNRIILSSGEFFDRNNNIIADADKKTFIESIILANPMCTISYTNTDKIKTAYFVNGDEYTTELLWHTPISKVSVELYPSYIVNHGNISNITYKFTDEYSNNDSDTYIIPNVNTNINKNNDIYTIAFSGTNILNNLDINFDNTIEEKKYKVCNTVLVGENQNVIECVYNTVTLIADVPSKTPITASVIVKQEIPKFKLNNDWPQEPTP